MKAEHRKELETNVLADRMGKILHGAREGPSRSFIYWILGGLALLVVVFVFSRWRTTRSEQAALQWVMFEDGHPQYLEKIAKEAADRDTGKAAQFQLAWEDLWTKGIKLLGGPNSYKVAMSNIDLAEQRYKKLAETCKNDPIFYPEALYALAVIEETRAIEDRDNLEKAKEKYKEVVRAAKESSFGRQASQRLEVLEDETKSRDLKRFYQDLQVYVKPPEKILPPDPKMPHLFDLDGKGDAKKVSDLFSLPPAVSPEKDDAKKTDAPAPPPPPKVEDRKTDDKKAPDEKKATEPTKK